ncbi:glucan endo-1,3-beta-glucosidase 2-like [Magnolia sinica]|uniref:glucan endo-1,3-beta-glucosidase 2-like n=1 Tax=Magnolia sinica TaxID=86752 RepID=UPI0026599709|nr:glucan endo-1,3-beta-glucosidase 2-like [Magnolia sinica]
MRLFSEKLLLAILVPMLIVLIFMSFYDPYNGSSNPSIGITYSQHPTSDLPHPDHVVSNLQSLGVAHVRLLDPDPEIVRAFSNSGISLLLSIPNTYIHAIAANQTKAIKWLYSHVVPFYPRAHITTISVGNDVLASSPELSTSLVKAIQNVYLALHKLRIHNISVSTTLSFDVITNPFPPSAAEFQKPAAEWMMKPLLDLISATNSSFLINAYPYKLCRSYPAIPIRFALFQNVRHDPMLGVQYQNLFDVMVDAVISAIAKAGHKNIPVVVTETGWPSDGDVNEREANEVFAKMYNEGLVRHLKSGIGTPLQREGAAETYIFELLDDETKQGPESDRHWGILNRNMTMKYGIDFSGLHRYSWFELAVKVANICLILLIIASIFVLLLPEDDL